MPEAASTTGWKASVSALSQSAPAPATGTTRMGLQFELRERTRASSGRWDAPKSRTATADAGRGMLRLGVRPVTLSETGNWVRGSLTWTTLPHLLNRLGVSREQHHWFGQFAALHRSGRDVYVPGEADWLFIDEFASPLLWPLLADAEKLGIAFVTGKRETDVTVADGARVTVDASSDRDATLRLRTVAMVGDRAHPVTRAAAVADHGLYVWEFAPEPRFTLARTAAPLSTEQRRLLSGPAVIDVPAAEAGEFLRDYYPRLQSVIDVVSTDASVAFPEILPPLLVLSATFGENDRLELGWGWESAGAHEALAAHPVPPGITAALGEEPGTAVLSGVAAAEFAAEVLPVLEQRTDLRVDVFGERPEYRELTETPKLVVTTVETDKRDWFDLGVMVTVAGRTIPFTPLFSALSKGRPKLLLVDKSYLSLNQPVFDELKRLIDEAQELDEWEPGGLRISRYQTALWSEFVELADEAHQAEAWRRTVDGLRGIRDGESLEALAVPVSVQADLRPYQVDGFRWLAFLWEHGLGGILADDMGLGKTLQTLALIAHTRDVTLPADRRPFLVVAPTSVVSNWQSEAARFAPDLVVRGITATAAKSRAKLKALAEGADLVVTSYALFRLDFAAYQAVDWAGLILDEAQLIKNRSSKAHEAAVNLNAPFKLAITGTPMENNLLDIWSLFRVVSPDSCLRGSDSRSGI
ncbi:DEAD/DEAH box helicase [Leifsonia poae]|uniref:DEAD/DEAH box helicase n=1 Tax=Leifsonia poae TaxID=110933 RepID=UPI003D66C006